MDLGLYYQPRWEPVPEPVAFTDVRYDESTTECEFRSFLHKLHYLPVHLIDENSGHHLMLPSGVVVTFSDEKLHSLKVTQQRTKEKTSAPLSDEREPSKSQIDEMLQEAVSLAAAGAVRAGFVMAWSGLEAVLRQVAMRRGLQARIGVQPTIIMRELYSARILNPEEMAVLEEARQVRTGIVHGLAPQPLAADAITRILMVARRLIDENGETPE
jgi:hypothetical protein